VVPIPYIDKNSFHTGDGTSAASRSNNSKHYVINLLMNPLFSENPTSIIVLKYKYENFKDNFNIYAAYLKYVCVFVHLPNNNNINNNNNNK